MSSKNPHNNPDNLLASLDITKGIDFCQNGPMTKERKLSSLVKMLSSERSHYFYSPTNLITLNRRTQKRREGKRANCLDGSWKVFAISGPEELRKQTMDLIALLASKCTESRWHVNDMGLPSRPHMEHLHHLTANSVGVHPAEAMVFFGDNDDMFHPKRIKVFQDTYTDLHLPDWAPFHPPLQRMANPHLARIGTSLSRKCPTLTLQKTNNDLHSNLVPMITTQ
jgi:hypothetical protein